MATKSAALEDKRQQLLGAAVRVFARKGFHASRVGDIAEEAGVAHGLLYHYFKSKDQVLEAVFHENWSVLLARIASVFIEGWPRRQPDAASDGGRGRRSIAHGWW